jgi:hypothetical protein
MTNTTLRTEVSRYYSNNGTRVAMVYANSNYTYEVIVEENGEVLYEGKYNSVELAENVAEDWVLTYYKGDLSWRQKP